MKILDVLKKMLNIRLLMQFSLFSLLLFEVVERKMKSTDQILSKFPQNLKSEWPQEKRQETEERGRK